MATQTLPSSSLSPASTVRDFRPYSGMMIPDLIETVGKVSERPQPTLLYTLNLDREWYWMWRLEVNHFAPRFYATRYAAEKLVARYQKVLAAREARSHEETT